MRSMIQAISTADAERENSDHLVVNIDVTAVRERERKLRFLFYLFFGEFLASTGERERGGRYLGCWGYYGNVAGLNLKNLWLLFDGTICRRGEDWRWVLWEE